MASQLPNDHPGRIGPDSALDIPLAENTDDAVPEPFPQTPLGRIPPEIRVKIFTELLAIPPSYGGHDFATESSGSGNPPKTPNKFVHMEASWHQVTRTCRQVYLESHPVFFASKSYFLANPQELEHFLECDQISTPMRTVFQWDTITALCFKDLVGCFKLHSKELIDEVLSNPTEYPGLYDTREQLEAKTYEGIDTSVLCHDLKRLKSLRTVGLCIRVGEEMEYVNFLYGLIGMTRGLVEFVNASHWLFRSQNPEDAWSIQYACFTEGDFANGKDHEDVPFDVRCIELAVTDIDSRAPGLQEGDERYVEVQIQRHEEDSAPQRLLDENENDIDGRIASDHSDTELRDYYQARFEIPQDQFETSARAETSEHDNIIAPLELESNQIDQSSLLMLQSEDGLDSHRVTDTDQEEDQTFLGRANEKVSETQSKTSSDHQAADPSFSRSLASVTHNTPTDTENDRLFSTDTGDEDNQVQPDTKASDQAPQVPFLRHDSRVHPENATEASRVQDTLKDKAKEGGRRTNINYLSGRKRQPLLDVILVPNPYTEEEMESYQKWQQQAISGNKEQTEQDSPQAQRTSSPFGKTQERQMMGQCATSPTATPKEERPSSPALPNRSGLTSKAFQIGAVSFLFLLLVMFTHLPGWLPNAGRDGKGSSQQ